MSDRPIIGEAELAAAVAALEEYRGAKAALDARILENEDWWRLRHWKYLRSGDGAACEPASAWLFSSLTNKHADAMDSYPEPCVLPRESGDEEAARILSKVLPVVLERAGFEQTYSDNWWCKLKHGVSAYGVFWNPSLEGGLGDVDIRPVNILNLFWEPGVEKLADSRNLFILSSRDTAALEEEYPQLRGKTGPASPYSAALGGVQEGRTLVVDWYYKKPVSGGTVLHYCKFAEKTVLFATENEPAYAQTGLYAHGEYPVVLDVLYPEPGTPAGFGLIAVSKDPQTYIDRLSAGILEMTERASRPRFWMKKGCGINKAQFLDWNEPLVEVEGSIDDERLKPITLNRMDEQWIKVLQMKIDEMKETTSNRDFNQGGTSGGVTAASAISALQETGTKTSRDMIAASYRAYSRVLALCIELIRQFYDGEREFRVTGEKSGFLRFRGRDLGAGRPIFDVSIRPRKQDPYSKVSQNELARELFSLGVFDPDRASEALAMLKMMEFEGRDAVVAAVAANSAGASA